jgi:hypothetical protein
MIAAFATSTNLGPVERAGDEAPSLPRSLGHEGVFNRSSGPRVGPCRTRAETSG